MNIVIIYGGQSVEHDVSVLTALHCAKHFSEESTVNLVYMSRTGQMVTSGRYGILANLDFYLENRKKRKAKNCWFADKSLYKRTVFGAKKVTDIDAVMNCCHGGAGEDGRLAAFFDVIGIPVTSCDMVSAHAMQSKSRTREVLTANGFAQPKFVTVMKGQKPDLETAGFDFPVIVKPDTLGSSIGISVANTQAELDDALELAFTLDNIAIIEEFLENATEVNCSAFRYGMMLTSACEVINKSGDMFDFDTKYLDAGSGFVKKSNSAPKEEYKHADEIKKLAATAYDIFGASGVARADFLVVGDRIFLNEINTVPGFMAYHLWQGVGLPYTTLLEMMIKSAIEKPKKVQKTDFSSEILQKNRILVQ